MSDEKSAQLFGLDAEGWRPGTPAVFDGQVFGYPCANLRSVPPGDYFVQALLNLYETFHGVPPRASSRQGRHGPRSPAQERPERPGTIKIELSVAIETSATRRYDPPAMSDTESVRGFRRAVEVHEPFWCVPTVLFSRGALRQLLVELCGNVARAEYWAMFSR